MTNNFKRISDQIIQYIKGNIWIVFVSLFIVQSLLAIRFGMKVPWGGDEWFSYKNFTIMAYPFSVLTSVIKGLVGEVNNHNFILYRQQGLLWSFFVYLFSQKLCRFLLIAVIKTKQTFFITRDNFCFYEPANCTICCFNSYRSHKLCPSKKRVFCF